MPYSTADGRQQLLDELAEAGDLVGIALASLTEAYDQLDDATAERLETELFRPVQSAYGRIQRTHSQFAERYNLPSTSFEAQPRGLPSRGARDFVDSAVQAAGEADSALAALQDSMLPNEVGDAQLREGIREVRELLGGLSGRARELVRVLGR